MSDKPVAWMARNELLFSVVEDEIHYIPLYTKAQLDEMLRQLQAENDALRKTVDSLFAGLDSSLALNKAQVERNEK